MGKNGLRFLILNPMGKKRCGGILNPMGKRRRICGLDWIFNPMGMGMGKRRRCGGNIFNPMGRRRRRRRSGIIFNPMGRKKRCGDGDGDGDDHLLLLEDVLIEILLCLPVKSLLRFKSVCKSWRDLIHSSFFIDLHTSTTFNSSSSSNKFGSFILQTTEYSYKDNIKLYMLSYESGDGEYDNDEEDDDQKKKKKKMVSKVYDLGFLPIYKDYLLNDTLRMVGSCNGIICLHDTDVLDASRDITRQHYLNLRDVSLWNPATRQFRILPKSIPIEEKQYCHPSDFIGFGFDIKTKDYKVLRITIPYRCMCRVQVYSLSTDSWRLLEGINSLLVVGLQDLYPNSRIYLNGSLFFVGKKRYTNGTGDDFMLLSFDFTKEIFTTMQLPDNCSTYNNMVLSSLGGKIALFDCCYYKFCDIWVLNGQHGSSGLGVLNKESWTKLNSNLLFRMKEEENEQMKGRTGGKPRCISSNGEFALISTWEKKTLQLFNLVTKEAIKDFTIGDHRDLRDLRADVYKESLVSIMGGGNVLLRWQLPTHGTTYKLNLDAPFADCYRPFGIGLCLTSDTGGCIGVRSLQRRYVRDEEDGEALAMVEAIEWAIELGLSPIIIESDFENCLSFFMEEEDDDDDNNLTYWSSEAYSLLKEAKLLLNSSEIGISFQYCSRSCNYVADIAAKLGRERLSWDCMDWTAKFPGEMVRSLSKKNFASKT